MAVTDCLFQIVEYNGKPCMYIVIDTPASVERVAEAYIPLDVIQEAIGKQYDQIERRLGLDNTRSYLISAFEIPNGMPSRIAERCEIRNAELVLPRP